ncbi:MAG: hypothetical protein K2Q26_04400 [Bdellovibrionales bacterium]|nr:hypothetical protein [Bdellovibrionales bacterium]
MKKANMMIGLALLVITGCIGFLFLNGIGLRFAKLIKPSVYGKEAADAVVIRMFPDLSERKILILGVPTDQPEAQIFTDHLKDAYARHFKEEPRMITDVEKLETCKGPCWLVTRLEEAHSLDDDRLEYRNLSKNYLSIFIFDKNADPSEECKAKLRLNLNCLHDLSIREASRKMKTQDPYFFLNKYADNNFFVFIGKL